MELDTAIGGVMEYRKKLQDKNIRDNPGELSDVMVKLATYNGYIADHLADLHLNATQTATASFKAARDMEVGVTEAERFSKAESAEIRRDYEKAQYIYKSTGNLITALQTRVRALGDELARGSLQT